ncbi:MAG: hypothetical protein ACFFB6_02060, partial [Promethearchaeota archaeon]
MKEFKINRYITLKLERNKTNIYVNERLFKQCYYLKLNIPVNKIISLENIESIDEAVDKLGSINDSRKQEVSIDPETEFMAHCSNLQVWIENNYNSRLIHSNLAFPLLKKLYEVNDPLAKKVFKEEIIERFKSGYPN